MIERLFNYLEKRPRAILAAAVVFVLALSSMSALCFYALTVVVESEREEALDKLASSRQFYEEQSKLLQERANLNSDNIVRIADTFAPMLRAQAEEVRQLKDHVGTSRNDHQSGDRL